MNPQQATSATSLILSTLDENLAKRVLRAFRFIKQLCDDVKIYIPPEMEGEVRAFVAAADRGVDFAIEPRKSAYADNRETPYFCKSQSVNGRDPYEYHVHLTSDPDEDFVVIESPGGREYSISERFRVRDGQMRYI